MQVRRAQASHGQMPARSSLVRLNSSPWISDIEVSEELTQSCQRFAAYDSVSYNIDQTRTGVHKSLRVLT